MRFSWTHLTSLLLAAGTSSVLAAPTSQLSERAPAAAGYLSITFIGDKPNIYAHVAKAGSESTFNNLNGGNPILVPTLGTKGVRDPYLVKSPAGDKYWIIGTDLNIQAINNNWDLSVRNGSKSIFVWSSTDAVNWSRDSLVKVMPDSFNAGMVWAPSAQWDPATNSYAVFWASRVYAPTDTARSGTASNDRIYYSHTTDFVSFTTPQIWINASYNVIDQELLQLSSNSFVRFIKDESVTKVYTERSDTGLFGTWKRIDPNAFVINAVREGPASYKDINKPSRTWLWLDNYSGNGSYEAYYNDDITKNNWTLANPTLTPVGMRHGAVVQVTQAQLDALQAKYP